MVAVTVTVTEVFHEVDQGKSREKNQTNAGILEKTKGICI